MAEFFNDDIDFAAYLRDTDAKQKVRPASEFVDEAKARLRARVSQKRTFLPWPKCNGSFEFRPGEVTLWVGQNGHGKTDMTTQVALSIAGQSEKVCIASLEMKPVVTVQRMARMFAGTNPFLAEYQNEDGLVALDAMYDDFAGWSNERLWLYDQTGMANPQTMLGMVKYCGLELGVTHIFVDSLMKCVRSEDDYNGQKDFLDQLCSIARDCSVHVHLVHHQRKPAKEGDTPDKHDTKGSGSITDQVDNIFMVWRNKPKEDMHRSKGSASPKKMEPDCMLFCKKQRNYDGSDDGEPAISLWRHRDAGQFVAEPDSPPQVFCNYPHVSSAY